MNLGTTFCLLGMLASCYLFYKNASESNLLKFPFLCSAVHLVYVFPKLYMVSVSQDPISNYYRMHGVDIVMCAMAFFCYLGGLLGYYSLRKRLELAPRASLSNHQTQYLTVVGVLLGMVSLYSVTELAARSGGFSSFFSEGGYYEQELRGSTVWLLFAARFVYVAIACIAMVAVIQGFSKRYVFQTVALFLLCLYPLLNILLLYRRSDLVYLLFVVIYSLVVFRRLRINRSAVIGGTCLLVFTITLFPALRQEIISDGKYVDPVYEEAGFLSYIGSSYSVKPGSELIASASRIQSVMMSGELRWGTFLWNSLVSQFLPSSLVGPELKQNLLLLADPLGDRFRGRYDLLAYDNLAPFGFTEAYEQLSWFGWVIFLAIGALAALMERRTYTIRGEVFYMVSMPYIVLSATNDVYTLPAKLVTIWILTRLLPQGAKVSHHQSQALTYLSRSARHGYRH